MSKAPKAQAVTRAERIRLMIVASGLIVLLTGLTYRLFTLQVRDHERYSGIARKQQRRKRNLDPWRGDIYMREKDRPVLVAGSVGRHSLLIHGRQDDPERLVKGLADILRLDAHEQANLRLKVAKGRSFYFRRRGVSHQEAAAVKKASKTLTKIEEPGHKPRYVAELSGVDVFEEAVRLYPFGKLGSHVLGIVGIDGQGLMGVEKSFNEQLQGLAGLEEFEIDNRRRQLANLNSVTVPAMPGYSVVLTIDRRIQSIAEEAADRAFEKWEPESLSVVAVDPSTGRILALASRPTFDPEDLSDTPPGNLRCRLLTDPYEPGSTIKPLLVSRVWQMGRGHPDQAIDLPRTLSVKGRRKPIEDSHTVRVADRGTQQRDVITQSSNVGSYLLSCELDDEEFRETLKAFGLGRETGLPLAGECGGNLALTRNLNTGNRAALAQGYGLLVTPLQMAMAYAAIANGGTLYRPRLVSELLDADGEVARRFAPIPVARVLTHTVAREWMTPALASVVESRYGTARRTRLEDYTMAGKTGTSKKLVPAEGNPKKLVYSPSRTVCSFVGFAPVEETRIAIAVVVDDPSRKFGRTFGGNVAAPIAAEVVAKALKYLGAPTRPEPEPETAAADGHARERLASRLPGTPR